MSVYDINIEATLSNIKSIVNFMIYDSGISGYQIERLSAKGGGNKLSHQQISMIRNGNIKIGNLPYDTLIKLFTAFKNYKEEREYADYLNTHPAK